MKDATAIAVVVDRSGSMHPRKVDVIGGFNGFVDEQKKQPGEATLTLIMFNTDYDVVYADRNIQDVTHLNTENYSPGGSTALLDAVGICIDTLGEKLSGKLDKDRPDKVVVVIMTDGEENSSKKHTLGSIREKIEHQKEKYKWEFLFIGAGIDAFAGAKNMGIDAALQVSHSAEGVRKSYKSMSSRVASYRGGGSVRVSDNTSDEDLP